jgi:hypothetical protein
MIDCSGNTPEKRVDGVLADPPGKGDAGIRDHSGSVFTDMGRSTPSQSDLILRKRRELRRSDPTDLFRELSALAKK